MVIAASDGFFGALNDFFGSGGWPILRNLSIFLVVVFWLAIGYWVYKDARRRIEDPWLVAMATVLGLVPPFVGCSSTCSSGRRSTSRTCTSASSRSRRWRSASATGASSTAPSAARRSTRTSSSVPSARRGFGSPARRARRRSSRCGRSARTARHRSRRRPRCNFRRSSRRESKPGPSSIRPPWPSREHSS